jgi:hypothetical protein
VAERALFVVMATGSRRWKDLSVGERCRRIDVALHALRQIAQSAAARGRHVVLIHGDEPEGMDANVDWIGRRLGFTVKGYAAKWHAHGDAAGPIRNTQMVRELEKARRVYTPALAIGFPDSQSRGTVDAMKKARAASIPVWHPASRTPLDVTLLELLGDEPGSVGAGATTPANRPESS